MLQPSTPKTGSSPTLAFFSEDNFEEVVEDCPFDANKENIPPLSCTKTLSALQKIVRYHHYFFDQQ